MGLHLHAVALAHALEQHPHVKFAHAVEDGLVDRGVMLDAHARIFRGELVESVCQTLLVSTPLGLDRDPEHRWRE